MVTPVGFNAPASCAAMRVGIDAFAETQFKFDGDWLIGAQVPFSERWRGREKLLNMVVPAIAECLHGFPSESLKTIPLLLCLAEQDRPGRLPGQDESLLREIEESLGIRFSSASTIFNEGRISGLKAIELASQLLVREVSRCLVVGVDSLLVGTTLDTLYEVGRLKTEFNSNGFIPGEAGAAILLGPVDSSTPHLACIGLGYGTEHATILSEEPLRGEGLKKAINSAMRDAAVTWEYIDFRITDANGEQYWFKEASLALMRTLRIHKEEVDLWHPADSIGEIGAAIVPCVLGISLFAVSKQYAPGTGILCHFSADGEERGALVMQGSMSRDWPSALRG
jgi:3-oxoacyl-[acyl-carrier-protein] synthase-1